MKLIPRFSRLRREGFTLIELVMTIVVLGIVSLPLSLLLGRHIQSVFISEDYTTALNLARFEMEKVNNMTYNSIASRNFPNYRGYSYDLTRTVTYAQGSDSSAERLKRIIVEVRKSGGPEILTSMVTYIARNIIYEP